MSDSGTLRPPRTGWGADPPEKGALFRPASAANHFAALTARKVPRGGWRKAELFCSIPRGERLPEGKAAVRDGSQASPKAVRGEEYPLHRRARRGIPLRTNQARIFIFQGGRLLPQHLCQTVDGKEQVGGLKTADDGGQAEFPREKGKLN